MSENFASRGERQVNGSPVLDTRGAADFLGISPRTLEGFRVRGGGPRYTKIGGAVRYRLASLEEYLRQQERASTSDPGAARVRDATRTP